MKLLKNSKKKLETFTSNKRGVSAKKFLRIFRDLEILDGKMSGGEGLAGGSRWDT